MTLPITIRDIQCQQYLVRAENHSTNKKFGTERTQETLPFLQKITFIIINNIRDRRNRPEQTGTDEALEHVTPGRGSLDACQAGASLEVEASLHHCQQTLHGHPSREHKSM